MVPNLGPKRACRALTSRPRNALFAPKGTPKEIIAKLNAAAVAALADPPCGPSSAAAGQEIPPREQQTPAGLGALLNADSEKVVANHQGGQTSSAE